MLPPATTPNRPTSSPKPQVLTALRPTRYSANVRLYSWLVAMAWLLWWQPAPHGDLPASDSIHRRTVKLRYSRSSAWAASPARPSSPATTANFGPGRPPPSASEIVHGVGLSKLVDDVVASTTTPSLKLTATRAENELHPYASKLGGVFYAPPGFMWPMTTLQQPMRLLAQLNFVELPRVLHPGSPPRVTGSFGVAAAMLSRVA